MSSFRKSFSLEKRKEESDRILKKYPERIPVIVEKHEKSDAPLIDKKKFLVPFDLTVGQFVYVIRKRIKLSPDKGICLFANQQAMPSPSMIMSQLYNQEKDEDGFLYIQYSCESSFGQVN